MWIYHLELLDFFALAGELRICVTIEDMEYTSKDLARQFGITSEALRQWCIEFRRHLSAGAGGKGDGSHRRFSLADVEILSLVHEMRQRKIKWEDIHASLDSGQRGSIPVDGTALVPLESQKQIALLMDKVEKQRSTIAALESDLVAAKTRADRAEGAHDILMKQIKGLEETIIQLRIELHEVEGKEKK